MSNIIKLIFLLINVLFLSSIACAFDDDPCNVLSNSYVKGTWHTINGSNGVDDCVWNVTGKAQKYKDIIRFQLDLSPIEGCTKHYTNHILNGTCKNAVIMTQKSSINGPMQGTILDHLVTLQSNDPYPDDVQLQVIS